MKYWYLFVRTAAISWRRQYAFDVPAITGTDIVDEEKDQPEEDGHLLLPVDLKQFGCGSGSNRVFLLAFRQWMWCSDSIDRKKCGNTIDMVSFVSMTTFISHEKKEVSFFLIHKNYMF